MIIQSTRIWILEQWLAAQLEIQEGKISRILKLNTLPVDKDYGQAKILPGFIDTHCHGAFGFDTNDANPNGLRDWLKKAPEEGLTSLCPTTITQSETVLIKALESVAAVYTSKPQGTQIVGIHFEGPYLNVTYKGAQPEPYIVKPNLNQFARYQKAAQNLIKIITVAAEEDKDFEFIRTVSAQGVAVNIGHSSATYEQALFAFANGAKGVTHAFNGMTPLNHREPGLAGAALRLNSTFSELICDGVHVSFPVMNLLYQAKGKDRLVMVTDALCAKGVGIGRYEFGGQMIDIKADGGAYLADTTKLAGSTLKFNMGLKNVIEKAQVNEVSAINSTSLNPARLLGIDQHKGKIETHYDADLVVLDDAYEVLETYVAGKVVYSKS